MPDKPSNGRPLAALVMLATLVTVAVNFLAATGRLNGVLPNEISDRYPTVITPAGWAFSIWSLIYVGLIAFSIYQLLPSALERFRHVRIAYIVSCLLNCAWILFWHHWHIGVCALVISALLLTLLWIVARLHQPKSLGEATVSTAVFGLYAGWVTVATFVNLLVYLVSAGVTISPTSWNMIGIVCLTVATLAAIALRVRVNNFVYPLAIAWAAAAIGAKQSANTAVVVSTAIVCIGCLIISGTIVTELRTRTGE